MCRRLIVAFALVGALVAAAGCGDGDESASQEDRFCDALRPVGPLDAELDGLQRRATDWQTLQPALVDALARTGDAYRRAQADAPSDLSDEVSDLRGFTDTASKQAGTSRTVDEFRTSVLSDRAAAVRAGAASRTLDRFTRDTCGFSINNEG